MKGEGAYELVFTKWREKRKKNLPLTIYGDGKQTRDFTHVSDTVDALVSSMNSVQKTLHEVINIGSGRQISVNYLATLFNHRKRHMTPRRFEERFKQADVRKARRLLSWVPKVSIEEGIEELLKK